MASTIEWDDAAFSRGLGEALKRLGIRTEQDLQRVGIRVQNRARQNCPVDTGRLRSSIQHKMGRDARGPFVEIGTNVEYAADVEFGTSRNRAQPYLRPAVLEVIVGGIR